MRCTGHCCRIFWVSNNKVVAKSLEEVSLVEGINEAFVDMLVPLSLEETRTRLQENGLAHLDETKAQYFTCKHLQENGDCGIYENRPQMCVNYPSDGKCLYKSCTNTT